MAFESEIFPSKAIRSSNKEETDFLVGREDSIIYGLLQILKTDSIIAITGERGVGKTSVASQILNSLSSDNSKYLQNILNIKEAIGYDFNRFDCIYIECSADLINLNGLIKKIIITKESPGELSDVSLYTIFQRMSAEPDFEDLLQKEFGIKLNHNINYLDPTDFGDESTLKDRFINLLRKLNDRASSNIRDLVIFVDEFDRLPDVTGVGEFVKQAGHVRFVFIGLPEGIQKIVQDHLSVKRKIISLYLGRLSFDNVRDYINKGQQKSIASKHVEFDNEFIDNVYNYSDGYPPIMQKYGDLTLMDGLINSIKNKQKKVNASESFTKVTEEIVKSEFSLNGDLQRQKLKLIDNTGKDDIVTSLANMNGLVHLETTLRKKVKSQYRFIDNCDDLIKAQILMRMEENMITFFDPYFRLIIKFFQLTNNKIYKFERKKEN